MNDVINRKDAIGAILSVEHIAELSDGDAVIRVSAVNYVLGNLPSAQPEKAQLSGENATFDCISRQTAIDAVQGIGRLATLPDNDAVVRMSAVEYVLFNLPSAQLEPSEITDEQAILHLQSTGWMQNHDREMYESGLRERLADDSDSYDALLPSAQPEEAIPTAWLEEQAKWFESMDNAFAKIEANNIRVMIKKWRSEKDERSD